MSRDGRVALVGDTDDPVLLSRELLHLVCPALLTLLSGETDAILLPGVPRESILLLEEVVTGCGGDTGLYSYQAIEGFLSLAEALGLGDIELVGSPPNSQETSPVSSTRG